MMNSMPDKTPKLEKAIYDFVHQRTSITLPVHTKDLAEFLENNGISSDCSAIGLAICTLVGEEKLLLSVVGPYTDAGQIPFSKSEAVLWTLITINHL